MVKSSVEEPRSATCLFESGDITMMTIHCPGCHVRLTVPADAGGRAARCPTCRIKFRVPDPRTMLDETVAAWMDLDQPDPIRGEGEPADPLAAPQAHDAPQGAVEAPSSESPDATEPTEPCPESAPARPPEALTSRGHAHPADPAEARLDSDGDGDGCAPAPATDAAPPDESPAPAPSSGAWDGASGSRRRRGGTFVTGRPTARPTRPTAKPESPPSEAASGACLRVKDVGSFGVAMTFASTLLNLPAFRASLPMRCIFTGEEDPAKLIARPLPWLDKATGHFADPRELEARYEFNVRHHMTPRQVVKQMPTILELPGPFNAPMPYYVARHRRSHGGTIHCQTLAGSTGVECEVVIPDIRYALEWLGRVNGVCGADYEQLEQQAVKFEAEAWQAIPESVRNRLAVWFDFQGDEAFLGYFNDADFSRGDAGLAGLILTDQRLVFTKYHHHGTLSLHAGGELTGERDGTFVTIAYTRSNGGRRKLVRLRPEDAGDLARMLEDLDADIRLNLPETKHPQPPEGRP